jgi:hypothetical protein
MLEISDPLKFRRLRNLLSRDTTPSLAGLATTNRAEGEQRGTFENISLSINVKQLLVGYLCNPSKITRDFYG